MKINDNSRLTKLRAKEHAFVTSHVNIYGIAKTKALISFAVTVKLIFVFVSHIRFSHDAAHMHLRIQLLESFMLQSSAPYMRLQLP